jgi:tRNA-binding EMAP/Myf-like protein
VGKINVVKDHPNADVLYLLDCDLGDPETRQVVTNIKPTTPKEVLEGKNLIFLANLKPVAFRGEKTFAMIFGGSSQDDSTHELVSPLNTAFLPQWGVKCANLADIPVESGDDLIKPGSRLFLAGQKPVDGEVARQNDKNIPKLMSQFSTNEATGELTFAGHKVVVKGINGNEIDLGLSGIPNAKFSQ